MTNQVALLLIVLFFSLGAFIAPAGMAVTYGLFCVTSLTLGIQLIQPTTGRETHPLGFAALTYLSTLL